MITGLSLTWNEVVLSQNTTVYKENVRLLPF